MVRLILQLLTTSSSLYLFVCLFFGYVEARTNQEPVNVGFIFSLPWDIANTLRAPVAALLSIVLASGLALICFAGLAFAPLWWIFGFPKRNYHLHSVPQRDDSVQVSTQGPIYDGNGSQSFNDDIDFDSEDLNYTIKNETDFTNSYPNSYPDFLESWFHFVPPYWEEDCKKLLVCHGHGWLSLVPSDPWVKIYQFFSKKMTNIPENYKDAVVAGLKDQGSCMERYQDYGGDGGGCTKDIVTLAKSTLFYNIPTWIRKLWKLEIV